MIERLIKKRSGEGFERKGKRREKERKREERRRERERREGEKESECVSMTPFLRFAFFPVLFGLLFCSVLFLLSVCFSLLA